MQMLSKIKKNHLPFLLSKISFQKRESVLNEVLQRLLFYHEMTTKQKINFYLADSRNICFIKEN